MNATPKEILMSAGIGALIGMLLDREDRVKGALRGAVIGASVMAPAIAKKVDKPVIDAKFEETERAG